jgi:hypothetical protein
MRTQGTEHKKKNRFCWYCGEKKPEKKVYTGYWGGSDNICKTKKEAETLAGCAKCVYGPMDNDCSKAFDNVNPDTGACLSFKPKPTFAKGEDETDGEWDKRLGCVECRHADPPNGSADYLICGHSQRINKLSHILNTGISQIGEVDQSGRCTKFEKKPEPKPWDKGWHAWRTKKGCWTCKHWDSHILNNGSYTEGPVGSRNKVGRFGYCAIDSENNDAGGKSRDTELVDGRCKHWEGKQVGDGPYVKADQPDKILLMRDSAEWIDVYPCEIKALIANLSQFIAPEDKDENK